MRTVRWAMVGGGPGSFMGPVHRRAAAMDGHLTLVAGSFSTDPHRNRQAAAEAGIDPARAFDHAIAMLDHEAGLDPSIRAELVSIVAPNHVHADIACAALARGFAVFCEKPLSLNLTEGRRVALACSRTGGGLGIAFTYLGYPMVHEVRARIANGEIGDLRRVAVSYTQGWLADAVESAGNAQAAWRTDPTRAGTSGCFGDIGVHAQSLVEFAVGSPITHVMAELNSRVAGRVLDDDGGALFRLANGATGTLVASQICAGEQNRLEIAVFGAKGSLRWAQEHPSQLLMTDGVGRATVIGANPAMLVSAAARDALRLPGGHPEGYLEALANLYRSFALKLRDAATPNAMAIPDVEQGLRGLAFVEAALASIRTGTWARLNA